MLYEFLFSTMPATFPAHLIPLYLTIQIISGDKFKQGPSTLCHFLLTAINSSFLNQNVFLSNPTLACILSVMTAANNATADNCQSQLQPISARTRHHQLTMSTKNTYKD
jgi:hypothetical protein